MIVGLVRREKPTLRQLLGYLAGRARPLRQHRHAGADRRPDRGLVHDGAADGFNLMPPVLPAMLDVFIAEVVPLLQRRGLFRTDYAADTLRGHYGLDRPAARF